MKQCIDYYIFKTCKLFTTRFLSFDFFSEWSKDFFLLLCWVKIIFELIRKKSGLGSGDLEFVKPFFELQSMCVVILQLKWDFTVYFLHFFRNVPKWNLHEYNWKFPLWMLSWICLWRSISSMYWQKWMSWRQSLHRHSDPKSIISIENNLFWTFFKVLRI